MRLAIFTCERDWAKAGLAARTVPESWSICYVVEERDAGLVPPPGVDVVVRNFPRGENLRGLEAVVGVADLLADQARQFGRVGKLDSDTLLVQPDFLLRGDVAGMAHRTAPLATYGCAYALSLEAVLRAAGGLKRGIGKGWCPGGEDVAITTLANQGTDLRLPVGAIWESRHDGGMPPAQAVAIHCGGLRYAAREGDAVAREMTRLGTALGIWRR